jgi:hypothetical protein
MIRIKLFFDDPRLADPSRLDATTVSAEIGPGKVPLAGQVPEYSRGGVFKSKFVLRSKGAWLEVYEVSPRPARPATQLALDDVKRELEKALASFDKTAPRISRQGPDQTDIELGYSWVSTPQPGVYQVRAWVNPGESGKSYLKVFEATRNTPLSVRDIPGWSSARVGWSNSPSELFRYQSEITVWEGDAGTFYPARFELWFRPDSGDTERKLVERIFKIEGYED